MKTKPDPREPSILRIHRLLKHGTAAAPTAIVITEHGTAAVRPNVKELLLKASATAQAFTPRRPTLHTLAQ